MGPTIYDMTIYIFEAKCWKVSILLYIFREVKYGSSKSVNLGRGIATWKCHHHEQQHLRALALLPAAAAPTISSSPRLLLPPPHQHRALTSCVTAPAPWGAATCLARAPTKWWRRMHPTLLQLLQDREAIMRCCFTYRCPQLPQMNYRFKILSIN